MLQDCKYSLWLQHTGMLSTALRKCCNDLTVQVLSQQHTPAFEYPEANACWVREVYLCADLTPWVFARVVAPQTTYLKYQAQFDALGTNLLGESLISKIENVARSEFKFHTIPDSLHKYGASNNLARSSTFDLDGHELLVTEVFLAAIPDYPK